ncbi:MAG: 8-amino-7-oxononanoate synthase [Pseudomonadota bacterium]|nr:8-amino-7-oxononanoate synthase [Pseudomonadota bacterium]
MQWLNDRCQQQLDAADQANLRRTLKPVDMSDGRTMNRNSTSYLQFASNDYLGLAAEPVDLGALQLSLPGSGASPLVTGYSQSHSVFEKSLASFTGYDAGLYFNSGFTANEGALSTLIQSQDIVFSDRLNHASLIDGVLHSKARSIRYHHSSVDDLKKRLEKTQPSEGGQRWIVTDAVFSMDGDIAPLAEIAQVARDYNAVLYVDDAHGLGVFGEKGQGSCHALGLSASEVDILMMTCGKAMGTSGACVLSQQTVIDFLVQKCRSYIYSTAPSPQTLEVASSQLKKLMLADQRRQHLKELSQYLFDELAARSQQGLFDIQSESHELQGMHHPVHPVIVGDPAIAISLGQYLLEHNIIVGVIRPPTVPQGTSRLRVSLNAAHTFEDVARLLNVIDSYFAKSS